MGGQRRLRRLRDGGGRTREGEKEHESEERRARARTPVIGRPSHVVLMPHHHTLPWPHLSNSRRIQAIGAQVPSSAYFGKRNAIWKISCQVGASSGRTTL